MTHKQTDLPKQSTDTSSKKMEEGSIELRSREVQEILARPPKSLIRYGTSVICGVLLILIVGSFFFEYPDIITGELIVTETQQLPDADEFKQDQIMVYAEVPSARAGKIKPGQKVNIKLDAYPYLEFGTLQGLTHTIEYIPDGNYYLVEVQIVKNLTTNSHKIIFLNERTPGIVEIITDNRSLMERILPFLKKSI